MALKSYELVFYAVYTPQNTRLLQEAAEFGAVVVSGVDMFIRQAVGRFKLFAGGLGTIFSYFDYFILEKSFVVSI